jgi:phenylalanyl-tRNA synthetase alpha chain
MQDLDSLVRQLASVEREACAAMAEAASVDALRAIEARWTGHESRLGKLRGQIKDLDPAVRKQAGQAINEAFGRVKGGFDERRRQLQQAAAQEERDAAERFDPTLPAETVRRGSLHPVTIVQWQIEDLFARLGFIVAGGPEMESDYYNFEALNIPAWHPARDTQDTFYLSNGMLLRTHTSPAQVRAMEHYGPPLRIIAPGRCFRYETIDASHENTFFQLEGLMIDRNISIANLIAVMKLLLQEIFEHEVTIRLRPGYFPFVEPGFELDMQCALCGGAGCATCKRSGWIEVLPCGMVHPNVLRFGGIDPHEYTGFAFGLGLTRLAMMRYGIGDIRVLNAGDLRGLVRPEVLDGPVIIAKE